MIKQRISSNPLEFPLHELTINSPSVRPEGCYISVIHCCYLFIKQKINQELQEALEDKEGLKQNVQEYILEVRRIEDVLNSKVG